ncbi:MAG: response regulator [Calditrichia bacterium]|nr:response regulator [Calditrichia bacterium]
MEEIKITYKKLIYMLISSFLIGAALLSFLSIFQKMALGAQPFALKGFIVPVFFGGTSGLFLGIWIFKLKFAFQKIEMQKENLRITLNSIGDAVIAVDNNGNITGMNPVAEKLTGWDLSEAVNKPLEDVFKIVNGKTKKAVDNPVKKVIKTGIIAGLANNTILISKNGIEFQIEDSAAPICDHKNNCFGVILTFKDITEKYKMEEMLRQKQKMEAIGNLAGGVAHDFNNMLAGIIGFSELLLLKNKDESNKKYINLIIETAERAGNLTKDLLSFARKGDVIFVISDLHNIINHSFELLKRTVDKKILLEKTLNAEHSIINGDISKLENVLLNLGINSRDAMPAGGKIIISTENVFLNQIFCNNCSFNLNPGNYIKLAFRDTGHGIKMEMHKEIFEPFYTTKEVGKGTGLGLAAVYGTIKEHNGAISVYSEEGAGTVFHLYFPLSAKDVMPEVKEEIIQKGSGGVLIADDEEIIRNSGKEILVELGYKVFLAKDGKDCMETYKKNVDKIDLILLDMIMPKTSGTDCFYKIKKLNPEAKVIICSGFTKDASLDELYKDGLSGFIQKPFRRKELSTKIAEVLNSKK